MWVCYHDNSKLRASIFTKLHGSVGEGSDHLQLIKFWPSRAPEKGVCGGAKFFGSALLQPARTVCVASERFFHCSLQLAIDFYTQSDFYARRYRPYLSVSVTFVYCTETAKDIRHYVIIFFLTWSAHYSFFLFVGRTYAVTKFKRQHRERWRGVKYTRCRKIRSFRPMSGYISER